MWKPCVFLEPNCVSPSCVATRQDRARSMNPGDSLGDLGLPVSLKTCQERIFGSSTGHTFHEDAICHDDLQDGWVEVCLVITKDTTDQSDALFHVLIFIFMDGLKKTRTMMFS